jgi:hypothetical protein
VTRALLRRDPAVHAMLGYSPLALLLGSLVWGMLSRTPLELGPVPYDHHVEGVYQMLIVVWSLPFGSLIVGKFFCRCTGRLDLTLPLAPRRLWLTRVSALVATNLTLLSVLAGTIAAGNLLHGSRPLLQPGLVSLGIHLGVGLILTVAVVQSPKPSLWTLPATTGYVALCIVSAAGYLALAVVLSALPRAWALAPLGVALILGLRVYLRLPASFSVAPLEDGRRVERHAAATGPGRRATKDPSVAWSSGARATRVRRFWLVRSTVFRSNLGNLTWLYLPVFAVHGLVLSDCGHSTHFAFFFLGMVLLAAWTMVSLDGLYRLDPLPIPRGHVFAVIVLSPLLALAAGYGLGTAGRALFGHEGPQVGYRPSPCCYRVEVPAKWWEISWDGMISPVTAPWGETIAPQGHRLVRGSSVKIFMPYCSSPVSSPRFVALQLSRAIHAVYGTVIPPEEIRERYLEVSANGEVQVRAGGFTLLQDYPDLTPRGGGTAFPVVILIVSLPWLVLTALVYRAHREGMKRNASKAMIMGMFALLILLGMGSIAASTVGLVDLWALSRWAGILVRQLGQRVPGGAAAIWCLSSSLLGTAYLLAGRQLQGVEAPIKQKGPGET